MGFYDEWISCINKTENDNFYIKSFLYHSIDSIDALEKSSKIDLIRIIDFLISYDKNKIIKLIDEDSIKILNPSDIIQFSNFDKGTVELTHILIYEKNGLTFDEIGYKLIGTESDGAAKKYGENHAKVAKGMSLVKFSSEKPYIVTNTNLGNFFPYLEEETQNKLISILCLRNPLIQNIIAKAKKGIVNYYDEVECIADSIKLRRKQNVKYILDLALKEINSDFINNIVF